MLRTLLVALVVLSPISAIATEDLPAEGKSEKISALHLPQPSAFDNTFDLDFKQQVRLSLAEILLSPEDLGKKRRLSLWNSPMGRLHYAATDEEYVETLNLSLVLPGGPLRFVNHGRLGSWYFHDPDPETQRQLWTGYTIQTLMPFVKELLGK